MPRASTDTYTFACFFDWFILISSLILLLLRWIHLLWELSWFFLATVSSYLTDRSPYLTSAFCFFSREREAYAQVLDKEIEGGGSSTSRNAVELEDGDEEEAFSAVVRPQRSSGKAQIMEIFNTTISMANSYRSILDMAASRLRLWVQSQLQSVLSVLC